jgi:hypothetical protein
MPQLSSSSSSSFDSDSMPQLSSSSSSNSSLIRKVNDCDRQLNDINVKLNEIINDFNKHNL